MTAKRWSYKRTNRTPCGRCGGRENVNGFCTVCGYRLRPAVRPENSLGDGTAAVLAALDAAGKAVRSC